MALERTNQLNNLTNNSLSSSGIQYRILAVLNAQGFKWTTALINIGAVRMVDMGRPNGQLCD
jgi:hypothetical protein